MTEAYGFLRRLEHRLQMVNDEQTHDMPRSDEGVDDIATFMGYDSGAAFRDDLLHHLGRVEHHYAHLFEEAPELGAGGALVFTGGENHPDTVQTLEDMGFADGGSISNIVRNWHHGRYRATRSERARQILTEMMPRLLRPSPAPPTPTRPSPGSTSSSPACPRACRFSRCSTPIRRCWTWWRKSWAARRASPTG